LDVVNGTSMACGPKLSHPLGILGP
jgi:hypothetical protein